jgi:hypothetical protein
MTKRTREMLAAELNRKYRLRMLADGCMIVAVVATVIALIIIGRVIP